MRHQQMLAVERCDGFVTGETVRFLSEESLLLLVQSHIKPSSLQEEQPLVHLSSAAAGPHDRSWVLTELPGRPHATKQLQEEQVVQQQVALRMAHHLRLLAHKHVALLQLSRKHSVLCSR